MAIRSYTGYLNSDLFGSENPSGTFDPAATDPIEILMVDGTGDLVIEGDSDGGSNSTEDSEDAEGDQFVFARQSDGTVIFNGQTFYLESSFTFTIAGQTFTGYHFEEDSGGGSVDFTILPPNLPAGIATVGTVNFTPNPDEVPYADLVSQDEVIDDAPYSNLDLTGADEIFAGAGDDTINAEGGDDTIDGGSGNDTINAGGGADTVYGGAGDDIINGGDGADVIRGDSTIDPAEINTEGTDFSTIPDPSGNGSAIDDGDDLSGGVSLNTGSMQVTLSFADDDPGTPAAGFSFNNSDTQFTDGLNNGDATTNDAILLSGNGTGDTSTTTISFSSNDPLVDDEVQNVNFRLNDIDDSGWRDIVTIRAFNADGNPVAVTLTGGADMVLSDTDGIAGNDTATAIDGSGNATPGSADNSLLVEIAGPVASIEISYGNLEPGGQRIDLTEIFFDTVPSDLASSFDDTIDGGAGADTIFGEQGSDTISGGTGADFIDGGVGDDDIDGGEDGDTIAISSGTDTIDGGTGSDTYDASQGTSLVGETITVNVDDDGNGTVIKSLDGTTDTITSVETFIADEALEENDSITLTASGLMAGDVSGIDDTAVGVFLPKDGSAPISFGGPGEPTFSQMLAGDNGIDRGPAGQYQISSGDEDGQVGNIAFQNFENIDFSIVCFADGTLIRTADGLCPVETLQVGDLVETCDHGQQPIRWIGHEKLGSTTLANKPNLRPIRIRAGALGDGIPSRDLVVSPQHRILVKSKVAIRMFDTNEILIPAKHLLEVEGIDIATDIKNVTYYHIMCDDHEIVEADGALAETLYTGPEAMKAMSPDAKQEIQEIFGDVPIMNRPLARLTPKGKHAKHLVARHIKNAKVLFSEQG